VIMAKFVTRGESRVCSTSPPSEQADPSPIDLDALKERVREQVRAALQQRADELRISYEDCLDRYFGRAGNA